MLSGRYPSDDFADLRPRLTWDRLKSTADRARRREARRRDQRRHDSGSRAVRRLPRRRARPGRARRRARRRDGLREPRRRDLPPRRLDLAHRADHPRSRARVAGARRAWQDAVLEGGRRRTAARARPRSRRARSHARADAARGRGRAAREPSRSRRAGQPRTCCATSPIRSKAAGAVPDDRTILIERCRDELGDWRICVLSPFGGRIHAPWAMAVVERARAETGLDVETMWTDDGFVVRFPETDEPPDPKLMVPASEEVEALVLRQLGGTAMFAAKFREAAGRALLLPKRRPGGRSPLWQQRKRAADLLAVASQVRIVPDAARGVSRMPARRVRHAGARRHAAPDRAARDPGR